MSPTAAVLLSLLLAGLIAAAWSKPSRTAVSGLLTRDKKGRLALVLAPAKKKRSKTKGKRKR